MAETTKKKPCLLDLPDEILVIILKNLHPETVHSTCSRINQRFKCITETYFEIIECLNLKDITTDGKDLPMLKRNLTKLRDYIVSKPSRNLYIRSIAWSLAYDNSEKGARTVERKLLQLSKYWKTMKLLYIFHVPYDLTTKFLTIFLKKLWRNLSGLKVIVVDILDFTVYETMAECPKLKTLHLINSGHELEGIGFQRYLLDASPYIISTEPKYKTVTTLHIQCCEEYQFLHATDNQFLSVTKTPPIRFTIDDDSFISLQVVARHIPSNKIFMNI